MVLCSFWISSPDKQNLQNVFQRYCVGRFGVSKELSLFCGLFGQDCLTLDVMEDQLLQHRGTYDLSADHTMEELNN